MLSLIPGCSSPKPADTGIFSILNPKNWSRLVSKWVGMLKVRTMPLDLGPKSLKNPPNFLQPTLAERASQRKCNVFHNILLCPDLDWF